MLSAVLAATAVAVVLEFARRHGPRLWASWTSGALERSPLAAAPDGKLVKVVGRIVAGERVLRAPLSGIRCVCWQVRASPAFGGLRLGYEPAAHGGIVSEAVPFWVEDGTGRARLVLDDYQVAGEPSATRSLGPLETPTPEVAALLDRVDLRRDLLAGGFGVCEFEEEVLVEGAEVEVVAVARLAPDPDPQGYRDAPPLLRLEAPDEGPLRVLFRSSG